MKVITLLFLTVFMGKSCSNEAQNDITNTAIQYTATSRGFYEKVIIVNQEATVFKNRRGEDNPQKIAISDADWSELVAQFSRINLEEMPNFKDPTQKRFFDGAAIANLKVRYQGKNYETFDFDHGNPPVEIAAFVNKIVTLVNKE